jgi:hypothetical protein
MGHRGPVLRHGCIGPRRALFYLLYVLITHMGGAIFMVVKTYRANASVAEIV